MCKLSIIIIETLTFLGIISSGAETAHDKMFMESQ